MKVEIYDPPMCCSSGLCGPSLDPVLIQVNDAVLSLKKQGVEVDRYNLSQQLREVMANKAVADLIHAQGKKVLPVTLVNGEIFMTGSYPSYVDLCRKLGIEPLPQIRPVGLSVLP